ncbi:hypothetical protein [Curtobacterium flaccumfaciens]|uniref:hypothetical protein n=1 Tax=Curtobacterium flaccumfaciens TaxID=2035 RepID=UPI0012DFEAA2|nr:hypothetical protein [Curtobacterium flaccumfaciens]
MTDLIDDLVETPMGIWPRVLTGIAGLGLSVAGLIAVFIKDTNVVGVPFLIVAGAALLYVALSGQRLIQVSKDGVIFGKAARLEKTLREATIDPDLSHDSKERLVDIAEDNGIHLPRRSAADLEIEVRQMFERLGEQHGFEIATRMVARDAGTDFALTNRADKTVAVEVKGRLRVRQFAEAVRALRATSWEQKMLVIDGVVPEDFVKPFRAEGIWIVGWEPGDDDRFIAILRQMGFVQS